ncbi:DUF1540 domain-containing protein [Terrisporobacter mayombei]|nr:DUF1540 domain-containing protein [Terrisporobacter mayombei]
MAKIDCSVTNCSHNKSSICYANIVNISGGAAEKECNTCCDSFLDYKHYSNLTNNTNDAGPCDALVCSVETCVYNNNKACTADGIQVDFHGNEPVIYTETNCATFKHK